MNGENPKMTLYELMSAINAEITAGLLHDGEQVQTPKDESRRQLGRFICVQAAGTEMAIRLSSIIEAGELSAIRSLPTLPPWLPGITNIRGNIVSVVDLESFLRDTPAVAAETRPFLRVSQNSMELAVTVQRILRTRVLYQGLEEELPDINDIPFTDFVSGQAWYLQDEKWHPVVLFDLERFLSSEKLLRTAQ